MQLRPGQVGRPSHRSDVDLACTRATRPLFGGRCFDADLVAGHCHEIELVDEAGLAQPHELGLEGSDRAPRKDSRLSARSRRSGCRCRRRRPRRLPRWRRCIGWCSPPEGFVDVMGAPPGSFRLIEQEDVLKGVMDVDSERPRHEEAPIKSVEVKQHPDRNAQFEHINADANRCIEAGLPHSSVDTRKKERVGNFKNAGKASGARSGSARANPSSWTCTASQATPSARPFHAGSTTPLTTARSSPSARTTTPRHSPLRRSKRGGGVWV